MFGGSLDPLPQKSPALPLRCAAVPLPSAPQQLCSCSPYTLEAPQNLKLRSLLKRLTAQLPFWHFKRLSNGAYKIASSLNNYCLDVQEFGKANGTNARAYPDNGCSAQQWFLYEENGAYTLRGACTDCYLDVSDNSGAEGQNIHLYEPNGTGAQRFSIQKTDMTRVSSNTSVGSGLDEPISSESTKEPPLPQSETWSLIDRLSESNNDIKASTSAILKRLFKA